MGSRIAKYNLIEFGRTVVDLREFVEYLLEMT